MGEQSEEYYGRTLEEIVRTLYRDILTDLHCALWFLRRSNMACSIKAGCDRCIVSETADRQTCRNLENFVTYS